MVGEATAATQPTRDIRLANHGLVVEPVVLDRLNPHSGDTVRLGTASFTIRGALPTEPDRVAAPSSSAPAS